jgi:F0F1-type ATP synthase gamma subunit
VAEPESDIASLERSMRAVTAIRQVVQAIWALSRAQLPLVDQAASAAVTYQHWVDAVLERVAGAATPLEVPRRLTVVFGPERPYSSGLARRIMEAIPGGELGIVGQRLADTVRQVAEIDRRVRFRCVGSVAHDDLHEVALGVARQLLEHGRDAVVAVMQPVNDGAAMSVVPLIATRSLVERPPETFSPLADVVEAAITEAMMGRLAVAAAEALRAEIRARIASADAARRACEERMAELESVWHLGRRETITRELLEVIAGQEAGSSSATSP